MFCELFPELVEKYQEELKLKLVRFTVNYFCVCCTHFFAQEAKLNSTSSEPQSTSVSASHSITAAGGAGALNGGHMDGNTSWAAMLGMLAAIIACTWAILTLL